MSDIFRTGFIRFPRYDRIEIQNPVIPVNLINPVLHLPKKLSVFVPLWQNNHKFIT